MLSGQGAGRHDRTLGGSVTTAAAACLCSRSIRADAMSSSLSRREAVADTNCAPRRLRPRRGSPLSTPAGSRTRGSTRRSPGARPDSRRGIVPSAVPRADGELVGIRRNVGLLLARVAGDRVISRRHHPIGGMMAGATTPVSTHREPELLVQTVVVIGGSAGIGLETARRARAEGADVILTGRNPDRLKQAALELGANYSAAFDANDTASLEAFLHDLPTPIDHVMVTAGGPRYGPLLEMDSAEVRQAISEHVVLGLEVARNAAGKMRPGGTLLLMGGTGGRRVGHGLGIASAATAALPPFTAALALELAPVRVNLIAAGFVDTPLSASLL